MQKFCFKTLRLKLVNTQHFYILKIEDKENLQNFELCFKMHTIIYLLKGKLEVIHKEKDICKEGELLFVKSCKALVNTFTQEGVFCAYVLAFDSLLLLECLSKYPLVLTPCDFRVKKNLNELNKLLFLQLYLKYELSYTNMSILKLSFEELFLSLCAFREFRGFLYELCSFYFINPNKFKSIFTKDFTSCTEMAEYFGCTPSVLAKKFKLSLGLTPKAFMDLRRFEEALFLLEFSLLSIEEISSKLGFKNSWFIARFKERFKITPYEYRKIYKRKENETIS